MKFRYKVMIANLILLSIALGMVGYLMIRKNFNLAKESAFQNAVTENNLVQSSVEYDLLQVLYGDEGYKIETALQEIGERLSDSMLTTDSSFYIVYNENFTCVYASDNNKSAFSTDLLENAVLGRKNYVFAKENDKHYVEVTSYAIVEEKPLYTVVKMDVSYVYEMLESQIKYFRIVLVVVIIVASIFMYLLSMFLTRPLEKLNVLTDEISRGNYDISIEVKSGDEIGRLADKFNNMTIAIKEHIDELNDMIHRREQFVADFTHEIKTPMTTIIGYADTMRSIELNKDEQMMALNYIFSEGKRLEEMSHKLFELLYLKQHDIEKTVINTENFVKEVKDIAEPLLQRNNIKLVCDVKPATILGSKELLITVFINLIDNARKASNENSVIELTGIDGDRYEFTVTDYGIGMTKEDQQKICDEFYMVDKSRTRKEGGAGLGMSLVSIILSHHNAELVIESELGKGTKMHILFDKIEGEVDENEEE